MTSWGALGLSLRGPQGPAGAAGPAGSQGPAGPSLWGGITGTLSAQADLQAALNLKLNASRLTVGPTAPASPQVNDLWVDTN
jgi:hypothetical protein